MKMLQNVHGGGLASSIVAKKWGDMALIEGQVKALNGCFFTVRLSETMECNTHRKVWKIFSLVEEFTLVWKKQWDGE